MGAHIFLCLIRASVNTLLLNYIGLIGPVIAPTPKTSIAKQRALHRCCSVSVLGTCLRPIRKFNPLMYPLMQKHLCRISWE